MWGELETWGKNTVLRHLSLMVFVDPGQMAKVLDCIFDRQVGLEEKKLESK